ncbi:MAG: FYVE zinc finger domain-containing protein [Desulfovibrio sp.]|uniref:FYVE zinc finger domain-containing protein n=1 Tax=Desulfovibrio sp. 7SRBS1 TaxID=3378064 RepID=UPI003B3F3838
MPALTPAQLNAFMAIPLGGENNSIPYPQAQRAQKIAAPCWSWALTGGTCLNNEVANGAPKLYENNAPVNPWTDVARAAIDTTNIINHASEPTLAADWIAARDEVGPPYPLRITFMGDMVRIAARANNLTPSAVATNYRLHVTAPDADWYHWQHWGISIVHGGHEKFIQTEPNTYINYGFDRLWEANRLGHIMASAYLTEILPEHKQGIVLAIMQPPAGATWVSDNASVNCQRCGHAFARQGFLWAKSGKHHCRRCGRLVCQTCSSHTTQVHNPLRSGGCFSAGFHITRVCDDCYALATG